LRIRSSAKSNAGASALHLPGTAVVTGLCRGRCGPRLDRQRRV